MPRYFFDIYDGEHFTADPKGNDLDCFEQARSEAVTILPAVAQMVLPDGDLRTISCVVRNSGGKKVFRATLTVLCEILS